MNPQVMYLNDTVFCRLAPSKIHGIGVFAIRDIPKGKAITDNTLENPKSEIFRLSELEFKLLTPEVQALILDRMIFMENLIIFISPNGDAFLQSFMNHSDEPNSDGLKALRYIKKGEEVTESYTSFGYKLHKFTKDHMDFLKP